MSRREFTVEEMEKLRANPNVSSVTPKYITYTNEFKEHVLQQRKSGRLLRAIFTEAGFDVRAIGMDRIKHCYQNWARCSKEARPFATASQNGGRRRKKEETEAERIARLEKEISKLRAENDFYRQRRRLEQRYQPQQSPLKKDSGR